MKRKSIINNLSNKEAVSIYKGKFNDNCRDLMLKSEEFQSCPVCDGPYYPLTLDHVLPKSEFTQFALTPINIVPLCWNCNKRKGEYVGLDYERSSFNPYFEDFSSLSGITIDVEFLDSYPRFKPKILYSKEVEPKLKKFTTYLRNGFFS
ncbi:hypothetical protein AAX19_02310 [Oenococcus oeni]|nr:hypothetical protein AAX19_02310 [Oenococcus oeni]